MPVHGPLGAACTISHGPECTALQADVVRPVAVSLNKATPRWHADTLPGSRLAMALSRVLHSELTLHFRGLPSVSI